MIKKEKGATKKSLSYVYFAVVVIFAYLLVCSYIGKINPNYSAFAFLADLPVFAIIITICTSSIARIFSLLLCLYAIDLLFQTLKTHTKEFLLVVEANLLLGGTILFLNPLSLFLIAFMHLLGI